MAGKIIADTIESAGSQISLNVGNVTILTASSTGLTLIPTTNVNVNLTNSIVTLTNGSATSPGLTFSGNTRTGLFMPSANTLAFTAANTESMRIDSSGNVGIGTNSPLNKLHISGATNSASGISIQSTGASGRRFTMYSDSAGGLVWYDDSGSAERMRIDTSGNVGIGTSSPDSLLHLQSASNFYIHLLKTSSNDGYIRNIGTMDIAAASGGSSGQCITFSTGANYAGLTTRAMIDGTGVAMFRNIGSTAPWDQNTAGQGAYTWLGHPTYTLGACNQNNIVAILNRYQGVGVVVEIKNGTTVTGSISHNGTNAAFNTSSDYRLKQNVQPMVGALTKIAQLKPVTYKWKADNSDGEGFIAHELAEVFPGAVTGEKDALKEDGSIDPQGIDTSFLIATLTAAIQELKAIVDAQAVEIAALKAK